jgi:hypothetical protein
MSDLKEFLDKKLFEINEETSIKVIDINDLGLFFWERGGKQFVLGKNNFYKNSDWYKKFEFKTYYSDAIETLLKQSNWAYLAQDFLDCLACLGEQKVKELIEKEGV